MYDRKYFYRKHLIKSSKGFGYIVTCVTQKSPNTAVVVHVAGIPALKRREAGRSVEAHPQLCMEFTEVSLCQTNYKKSRVNGVSLS